MSALCVCASVCVCVCVLPFNFFAGSNGQVAKLHAAKVLFVLLPQPEILKHRSCLTKRDLLPDLASFTKERGAAGRERGVTQFGILKVNESTRGGAGVLTRIC